jgi:EF-hand domain pair
MKRIATVSTLLLFTALPLGASAADPQAPAADKAPIDMPATSAGNTAGSAHSFFSQLDSNHDGYVSKDEAKRSANISATFDNLDANHDGKISSSEFLKSSQNKP